MDHSFETGFYLSLLELCDSIHCYGEVNVQHMINIIIMYYVPV